jgi:3-oxoacyl-[acyl-carrier protein] reductase
LTGGPSWTWPASPGGSWAKASSLRLAIGMDLGLKERTALVTGGTRGIGHAIAQALVAEGARVAVVARGLTGLEAAQRELGVTSIAADLGNEEGCAAAFGEARAALGPIDILVNNLGGRAGTKWADTGALEMALAMTVNLMAAVRMSKLALPEMTDRGWGRIIVIASIYGRETGGAPAYNAAKAAEISFAASLAREVGHRGVLVNSVAPGSILFEGGSWDRRQKADPQAIAGFVERDLPLKRFGRPEEVAAVIAFLCGEQASLVNGACITVDGGQSRSH